MKNSWQNVGLDVIKKSIVCAEFLVTLKSGT